MFLRIARSHVAPGTLSQAQIDSFNQGVANAIKPLPGLQHVYVASDVDSGHAVTVSIWDTREHAQFDRSVLGGVMGRLQQADVHIEASEIYEIAAQG